MQLENFSAWHNVPFAHAAERFCRQQPEARCSTIRSRSGTSRTCGDWSKKGYFTYAGRTNEAEAKFYSGECAMLTTSSAAYAHLKRNAKFKFGVSTLPYYADVAGAPQNTIIGGASLWVMAGKRRQSTRASPSSSPSCRVPRSRPSGTRQTGYLPITMAAYELTKNSGFYEKNPGTDVSVEQMIVKTTDKSRGVRLGNFVQIRDDHRRGARGRAGAARRPRRRRWTTPSLGATS